MSVEEWSDEPVLLVHGYMDTTYTPWWGMLKKYLRRMGCSDSHIYAINDGSVPGTGVGSPRKYARRIGSKVDEIHERHGEEVNIIAHSMGGLKSRWFVEELGGAGHVDDLVTLSTPHQGTKTAWLGMFSKGGREMRPSSSFIDQLNDGGLASDVGYTAVKSTLDFAVRPHTGAELPGTRRHPDARNLKAGAYSHIEMVARRSVFNTYRRFL